MSDLADAAARSAVARAATACVALWLTGATIWPFDALPLSHLSAQVLAAVTRLPDRESPIVFAVWFAFGVLAAAGLPCENRKRRSVAAAALAMFALALELLECLAANRHPSLVDGVISGLFVAVGVLVGAPFASVLARATHLLAPSVVVLAMLAAPALAVRAAALHSFDNWDESYPLALGGELIGEAPWRGAVGGLNIYARALTDSQIAGLARVSGATRRDLARTLGAQVIYERDGNEAARPDRSGLAPPLDLRPYTEGVARTTEPARRLTRALVSARTYTIDFEIDAPPAPFPSAAPASIVALARDPWNRNVSIAQVGDDLMVLMRTAWSGRAGRCQGACVWDGVFARPGRSHVAVTYRDAEVRVYVNGRRHETIVRIHRPAFAFGYDGPAGDAITPILLFAAIGLLWPPGPALIRLRWFAAAALAPTLSVLALAYVRAASPWLILAMIMCVVALAAARRGGQMLVNWPSSAPPVGQSPAQDD